MKYSFKIFAVVFLAALFIIGFIAVDSAKAKEEEKSCFYNSLHRTGEGMRYWYEEQGGFKAITGIPYENLDCKNCHVKSCDQCHVEKNGEKCLYSLKKAKDSKTCLDRLCLAPNLFFHGLIHQTRCVNRLGRA
jgi:hypothetical protein